MRHFRQALTANLFKERLAIASVVVELVDLLGSVVSAGEGGLYRQSPAGRSCRQMKSFSMQIRAELKRLRDLRLPTGAGCGRRTSPISTWNSARFQRLGAAKRGADPLD